MKPDPTYRNAIANEFLAAVAALSIANAGPGVRVRIRGGLSLSLGDNHGPNSISLLVFNQADRLWHHFHIPTATLRHEVRSILRQLL